MPILQMRRLRLCTEDSAAWLSSQGRWQHSSPDLLGSDTPLSCSSLPSACQLRARATGHLGPSAASGGIFNFHEARWREAEGEHWCEATSRQAPWAQPAPHPMCSTNPCSCRTCWKPQNHRVWSQGAQPTLQGGGAKETKIVTPLWLRTQKATCPLGAEAGPAAAWRVGIVECARPRQCPGCYKSFPLASVGPTSPSERVSPAHSFPNEAGFPSAATLPFRKGQPGKNDKIWGSLPKSPCLTPRAG